MIPPPEDRIANLLAELASLAKREQDARAAVREAVRRQSVAIAELLHLGCPSVRMARAVARATDKPLDISSLRRLADALRERKRRAQGRRTRAITRVTTESWTTHE